jgi:hypothetical protein
MQIIHLSMTEQATDAARNEAASRSQKGFHLKNLSWILSGCTLRCSILKTTIDPANAPVLVCVAAY